MSFQTRKTRNKDIFDETWELSDSNKTGAGFMAQKDIVHC